MLWAPMQGTVDSQGQAASKFLLHPTGEFAARFMIISMMATLLRMLFLGTAFPHWLTRHRRHFGVAAFLYAALHAVLYFFDKGALQPMLSELEQLEGQVRRYGRVRRRTAEGD